MSFSTISALLLVLSAVLMNTSLVSDASPGIPIFYAAVPLLFFLRAARRGLGVGRMIAVPKNVWMMTGLMLTSLVVVITLHSFFSIGDAEKSLKQMVARGMFFLFFFCAAVLMHSDDTNDQAWRFLNVALNVCYLYGFYQIVAGIFHLPLFLDFLRNNASFFMTENAAGGWVDLFRAFSIWSEPSFAALPVAISLYIAAFKPISKSERRWTYFLTGVFAVLTFSRTVWAVWLFCVAFIVFARRGGRAIIDYFAQHKLATYTVLLLAVVGLTQWATLFVGSETADYSTTSRAGSIIAGENIFFAYPFLGSGLNTFSKLGEQFSNVYLEEGYVVIHNMFVSYAQQMGIFGLVLSLGPVFYLMSLRRVVFEQRAMLAGAFVVIGTLGGDLGYFAFTWFVLALLAVDDSNIEERSEVPGSLVPVPV